MNGSTINNEVTNPGAGATVLAGRYRVVRQLGQGGMGSVWLAEDTQLDNRQVAIKMLPSILVSNKRAYQQLKSEALVSLKLTHPNIATLRAFEENGGNPFLVVDYIDGVTLDDYLAEKGKLTEEETVRLLTPVAAALDYAHSKGVVHRDVKPANVMIATDGTPYVLDFGIAREIQETLTRVTGKLSSGTLMYMSPEQLNGDAPTPAQDVYSFAVMVYECLKGEPPFVRGAIEDQIRHKPAAPLLGKVEIAASVMSALAKCPDERPLSCTDVLLVDDARPISTAATDDECDVDDNGACDEEEKDDLLDDENEEEGEDHDYDDEENTDDYGPMTEKSVEADILIAQREIDLHYRKLVDYGDAHPGSKVALEPVLAEIYRARSRDIPSDLAAAIELWNHLRELRRRLSAFADATEVKERIESTFVPKLDKCNAKVHVAKEYAGLQQRLKAGLQAYAEGRYDVSYRELSDIESDMLTLAESAGRACCRELVRLALKYEKAGMKDKFDEMVRAGLQVPTGDFVVSLHDARLQEYVFTASLDGREVSGAEVKLESWMKLPISVSRFGAPCLIRYQDPSGMYVGLLDTSKVDPTRFGSKVLIPLRHRPGLWSAMGVVWRDSKLGFLWLMLVSAFSAACICPFVGGLVLLVVGIFLHDLSPIAEMLICLSPFVCILLLIFRSCILSEVVVLCCKDDKCIQVPK